uniref:Uncharacterized protein n=1 Tax=Rhizophora mucronata TaxID=61149 RepID=A0A2P2ND42_RHIMU
MILDERGMCFTFKSLYNNGLLNCFLSPFFLDFLLGKKPFLVHLGSH